MHFDWHFALTLGLLLGASLLAGHIGEFLRLPRVTCYLLVGMLLGPNMLGLLAGRTGWEWFRQGTGEFFASLEDMEPFADLAIAMVLMSMGCRFTLVHFHRIFRRLLYLSAGELVLTFVLVAIGCLVVGSLLDNPLWWETALLLGALALATAPATTVMVLQENESEGTVTEYANALVVLNNLAAVVVFEILLMAIGAVSDRVPDMAEGGIRYPLLDLIGGFLGSIVLGFLAGILASLLYNLLVSPLRRFIFLISILAIVLGVCALSGIPYPLTFLLMGATIANASDRPGEIARSLRPATTFLCVIFFFYHGSEMDLRALWASGALGCTYIAMRFLGKYSGIWWTANARYDGPHVRSQLGLVLMSQAGTAIALALLSKEYAPALGGILLDVILGTVVFFEIVGPLLIRTAVVHAGEVPLDKMIHHRTTTPWDEIRAVWNRLTIADGRDNRSGINPEKLTVGELMKAHLKGLPDGADFDQLVDFIEHRRENTFPVVNAGNELVGVIRYDDVRDVLFDRQMSRLVRAADLTVPAKAFLYVDDPLSSAWQFFSNNSDDCWPVVTRQTPHQLAGIVRRKDLIRIFRRNRGASGD